MTTAPPHTPIFSNLTEVIAGLLPDEPVYVIDTARLQSNVRLFLEHFPGKMMYAVKCNRAAPILQIIYDAGVRYFDVASLKEIETVAQGFSPSRMFYMHPVKTEKHIARAHSEFAVRDFVIDHIDELRKLERAVPEREGRANVRVFVRIQTPPDEGISYVLSEKFGADPAQSVALLQAVAQGGFTPALALHVGSQCIGTAPYTKALALAHEIVQKSGIGIRALDVGGGFPAPYVNTPTFDLRAYFAAIADGLAVFEVEKNQIEVFCEPGRAIVADAVSLITQVHLRKDHRLYLNDGFYGSLAEIPLSHGSIQLSANAYTQSEGQVQALRPEPDQPCRRFTVLGPTCDSVDSMKDAISLSEEVQTGDWVVFDNMGAYSHALATDFNGFLPQQFVLLQS